MITETDNNNFFLSDIQFECFKNLVKKNERDISKIAYLTKSKLDLYLSDPVTFIERYGLKRRPPQTPSMKLGIDLHQFFQYLTSLDRVYPAGFMNRFAVRPEGMKFNTKEGKAWQKEQLASDKQIIEKTDQIFIESLLENFFSDPDLCSLSEAKLEYEKELVDEKLALLGVVDIIDHTNKVIYDIKTTGQENMFKKFSSFNEKPVLYQALIYKQVAKSQLKADYDFKFLLVQTTRPYHVVIYPETKEQVDDFNMNLHRAKEFFESDVNSYYDFYGRLVDLFGYDPIIAAKEKKDLTLQERIDLKSILKSDPFFKKFYKGKILEFNHWAMQNMKGVNHAIS